MFATLATWNSILGIAIDYHIVMVKTKVNYSKGESLELVTVNVAEVNKMNKPRNLEGTTKI